MKKIVLAALALGIPAVWVYFAHQWFGWHAVVYPSGDAWKPLSSGWETLWKAWPVLTAGLILALLVLFVVLWFMALWQERLEQQLREEAKRVLDQDLDLQREQAQRSRQIIYERTFELEASWAQLRVQEQQVAEQLLAMQARVAAAEARAEDAEARKKRAYGGFERIRRKQEREKAQRAVDALNRPLP